VYSGLVGVLAAPIVVGCGARPPLSLKPAVIVPIVPPDAHDAGTTVAVIPVETAEPGSLADVTSDLDGAAAAPTSQRSNGCLP
jgi:hypothetical protein